MKKILLSIVVLLVFSQHQGSCWLESPDEPFSAVRHLSASRQLRDSENDLDDSSSDIIDTAAISRTPRPLFSWELVTVTPTSSTSFPRFYNNQDESDNSDVSFVEQRKQRGKKMRNKKKKKKKVELIDGDENFNWHGSNINISSSTVDSNGNNNIPDSVVSSITRRRKHKNKMKKDKGKSYTEYDEEGVTKKRRKSEKSKQDRKQKGETSKEEKARKENKRKERKRMREERRQKQEKRKKDRLNENSPEVLMTEISMKSRSKNKMKFEMLNPELNPTMPSSSENTVEAVSGKYRRDRPLDINTEKYNDYNLEVVKNEINAGELPALYIPHNEPHKPVTKESTDDNNLLSGIILFPGVKENAKEDSKESFKEVQNENKITLVENDISSTTKLSNEKTVSNSHFPVSDIKQNTTQTEEITTVVNNQLLSGNEMESHAELELDLTTESSENGDLSCLSPTFLPAQPVKNAEIKYTRGKYLEAEYECLPDFKLVPEDAPRLICNKRQWIGDLPECEPVNKNLTNVSMKSVISGAISNNTSCGDNRGGCEQLCTLVEGKPICSCFRGFRLEGSTCHDIDECADSNGGCEVSCHNKPGSYECGCPSGFRLSVNGKSCLDINECLLRNGHGPCQDSCHNLPGSYKCSCEGIEGTRLSVDNHTCEDLDECARNNAGCSHTCLNTLGRAFCLCPPGFMLGTDWKTCHDIDECADPELQEGEHCSIGCVNTLGSYHCVDLRDQAPDEYPTTSEPTTPVPSLTTTAPTTTIAPVDCLPGFEAGPYGSCKDIDECATNNGGCSHTCKNTLGSAFCLCPPEFMLASDWKTCKEMHVRTTVKPKIPMACPPGHVVISGGRCKDVDECAIQNGGCMQGCVNIRGSFQCVCGRGFFLAADGKTCVEERVDIVCPPLPTPSYGYLHCTRRVFMVAPEQWRARWRRRIVNHAGAVCELRCPHGYRVQGEYRKVCESDGNWAGPEDGYCMPFPKPKIECPHNISVEIEPGQATAFVAFPQPVTDVDWFRNVVSKPSWGKLLEADLPIGRWSVTFTARHPISRHTASCTLGIKISSPALSTEVPEELA